MALTGDAPTGSTPRLLALGLAVGGPLSGAIATASAHGYWLDSGEFVAQGAVLGIAHPPGQPLAALVGYLATLLPFGPIAFRIAIASALCSGVAAGFLFRAIETTVRSVGVRSDLVSAPLALGATWLVAGSVGWWFQAVRPEVYALQAALLCIAIERLLTLEARWPTHDVRPLYQAAIALGFALANHHFLAFLLLPAMAPTLARVWRARGARPLAWTGASASIGLTTYAFLPIRAMTDVPLNLGDPSSPERFFWVVSAKVYQKNQGLLLAEPMADRFMEVALQTVLNLQFVPVFLALVGAYIMLRTGGARRLGAIWVILFLVFFAARGWLGFVRDNPDALGYLMPAFGAVGALAAAFVGAVLVLLGGADTQRPRRTAVAVSLLLGALGFAQLTRSADEASLARFSDTDAMTETERRLLPPRSIVLIHEPTTAFRLAGAQAETELRPDVTIVPLPLVTYPGVANQLAEAHPELGPLLRSYLYSGELEITELQNLARSRPLFVELDVRVPVSAYGILVPSTMYHEVLTDRAYDEDRRPGRLEQEKGWQVLMRLLVSDLNRETRLRLLWRSYNDALYFAATGDREGATIAAERGIAFAPAEAALPELEGLLNALKEGEGPIDVMPFRVQ